MNVRDIMSSPVVSVPPDARVATIARTMLANDVSGLPVVDTQGTLVGIVTESDLIVKHANVHVPTYLGILGGVLPIRSRGFDSEMRRVTGVTAEELMTVDVRTVDPGTTVEDAATIMVDDDVNQIPVLEDDRLVGIVSRSDILRLLLVEEEDADGSGS